MARNRLLAVLIVAATGLFAIGVAIERSQETQTEGSAELSHVEGVSAESAEGEAESAEAGHTEGGGSEEAGHSDSGEELLGIDPESVGLVIVAMVVSLGLAAAVWLRPEISWLLWLVAASMLVFAALDVREFIHQLDESRGGLAVLVAVVTLLHAGAAWLPSIARPGRGLIRPLHHLNVLGAAERHADDVQTPGQAGERELSNLVGAHT
jgi:hypothetical protein